MRLLMIFMIAVCSGLLPLESIGQIKYDANSNLSPKNLESKALVILYTNEISNAGFENNSSFRNDLHTMSEAEMYDAQVKKEFGSYVNPFSNQLNIVTNDDVDYTKIQIISKDSGETVSKKILKRGNNALDMSEIAPGVYILIMTDAGTKIFSEEITVI